MRYLSVWVPVQKGHFILFSHNVRFTSMAPRPWSAFVKLGMDFRFAAYKRAEAEVLAKGDVDAR
jgi:hypothetical protein